jgi:hypothetical protein
MSALIARLAPWALVALAACGFVIWGLWGRLEVAETKLSAAHAVIEQRELDVKANAVAVAQLATRPETCRHRNQGDHRDRKDLQCADHSRVCRQSFYARC